MTETVCLVMPAAQLAASTPSRTRDDRFRASSSIAKAEAQLRKSEAQARERADYRAGTSNEAIVARARAMMAEPGGTPNARDDGGAGRHAERDRGRAPGTRPAPRPALPSPKARPMPISSRGRAG